MDLDDLTKLCEEAGISLKNKLLLKLSESDLSSMTDDDWLRFLLIWKLITLRQSGAQEAQW